MRPNHWTERCKERGITCNAHKLKVRLEAAISAQDDKIVQLVCPTYGGGEKTGNVYRFQTEDGVFYAIASPSGRCITVITQDMVKSYKDVHRGKANSLRGSMRKEIAIEAEKRFFAKRRDRRRRKKWD